MRRLSLFTEPLPVARRVLLSVGAALAPLERGLASARTTRLALVAILAIALLAPLGPLSSNRFHGDEAIYSSWGLDIASGRDLLVSGSPVDKPPLFLYIQALSFLLFGPTEVAARLPSLAASLASVGLIYALGRSLYRGGVGLLAAFLLAASPFTILFAPTAFTDPLMAAWVLAGCLAAVRGRAGWAGVCIGLAAITKQQGAFFLPLALGLGYVYVATRKSANLQICKSTNLPIGESRNRGIRESANHPAFSGPRGAAGASQPRPANLPTFQPSPARTATGGRPGRASLPTFQPSSYFEIVRFAVGFLVTFALAIAWDVARGRQPGFMVQSLASYGDYPLSLTAIWERLLGFAALLRYGTGSPVLNWTLVLGWPLLLLVGIPRAFKISKDLKTSQVWSRSEARADLLLSAFIALFLGSHALVAFVVWDRYLLGLIPLLALLLARVLFLPWRLFERSRPGKWLGVLFVLAMLSFTLPPMRDAAASRFPIGGDHGAYRGIEQIVAYLRAVPADTTLYHRWLGWHWRFYLWGSPYDFRAWSSPGDLAAQAAARPGARRYVVFPSWRSSSEARLALADAGLVMREVQRAFRDDGSVAFIVYRIEEAP